MTARGVCAGPSCYQCTVPRTRLLSLSTRPLLDAPKQYRSISLDGHSLIYKRQGALTCAAQKDGDLATSGPVTFLLDYAGSLGITKDITKTQAYSVWLQGAVVLVILAAIDAAYSGDWSRIGVIPHEAELALRPLLGLLGLFHIFCGVIAAIAASKKGYNPVPATAKVLAVGFLALVEVLLKDPIEGGRNA